MCLPELSEDDSEEYEVCCGALHSYVASVFFCVIDFWSMFAMFFLIAFFHYDDPLTWLVMVPLFVLYISFISFLSGPIGLYLGHGLLITIYYYRIILMFIFDLIWLVISFKERKTILDTVFLILWLLTALTYCVALYIHRKTYKFFKTRWIGYDDGDLTFAAKLRAQGLPIAAYNMREYFASINLKHESERQQSKEIATAKMAKKD
ncbi:unnamed protein product [Onchocerca ochengi]|uniref:Transmembrane protein 138 n=2 Tax=Onchocerca TaxID=6281 RepID=A0A182E7Y4_ONCOC|nr:unnamed protein product [Onchocerca ochengi]